MAQLKNDATSGKKDLPRRRFQRRNWISERPDLPDHIAVSQIKTGVFYKTYSVIHFMCDAESHL